MNLPRGWLQADRIARRYADDCDGRPLVLLPGLSATPASMVVLRRALQQAGYPVVDWGEGRNLGIRTGLIERVTDRVRAQAERHGGSVTLIGWSLGGVFAREIGKSAPEAVRGVLTLGSPFSGDRRANNGWRAYRLLAGHPVDRAPVELETRVKPPVPTIALWSRNDGMIAPAAARGLRHESDKRIEIAVRHFSMAAHPRALEAVLRVLRDELP